MEQTLPQTFLLRELHVYGVSIIIGRRTGKLLYVGVRNKHCHACATEMEADVIVEGFLEAERVHGVRYMKFVGDGDSPMYPALVQNVPVRGYAIGKLECAKHACKCYHGALECLVQENPSYKGSGRLTQK